MQNKYFKNLEIGKKTLIIILLTSFIAQFSTGILAFKSIKNMSNYACTETSNLGETASQKSEEALKNQAKLYLKEIASSMAQASDNILDEVSDETTALSINAEDIYQNPQRFNAENLCLPGLTTSDEKKDRKDATPKAYVADPANSLTDSQETLAYDSSNYAPAYKNNVYKTNIANWMKLSDEERENIKKSKIVVSENPLPSEIKNEIKTLSAITPCSKGTYQSNLAVSSVYMGTQSGISYHYCQSDSQERYDPRTRPWYIDAVNAKSQGNETPIWQSTYVGKTDKKLCITCSKAFCDKAGKILGVVAIDMYLEDINKYIIGTNIATTGYAFVTDQNGEIIMHPDYNLSETQNNLQGFLYGSSAFETESESYKSLLSKMKSGESGIEAAQINNSQYWVAYSPMKTTNWSLGAASKAEEVLKPTAEMREFTTAKTSQANDSLKSDLFKVCIKFIILFLIFSALTYFLSARLAKEILNPVRKLRNQAKIIGEGDFSSRIEIESNDELGDLSRSFNAMAENLITYMENLKKTTSEKEKIHSELMLAKKIQRSMLPCIFPAFPERKDFDVYALMDPAKEVGGDFYDFFFVDENHFAFLIADVSGKGVSAALFMVIAKTLLKNQLQNGESAAQTLKIVNKRLCENNEAGMFVTAFVGIVNIKTGEFTFSNAGHNPPLIYKKSTDKYEFIKISKDFILGGIPDIEYTEDSARLYSGDVVFLYTDGVTEAANENGKLFSKERLESILSDPKAKKLNVHDTITLVRSSIDKFAGNSERTDDITMLAFKSFDIPQKKN